jgi:cell division protein FtsI/penicillin-binding protein 2
MLTTPLQLVQAYCALANNGWMMQLRVVDRIEHASGTIKSFDPIPIKHCVCVRAAKDITNALKLVTKDGGTAKAAAVPGYEVAGKTGTAQKFIDGAYSHEKYVASFIGYLPADDPAFVLLISADEPTEGSHYGGSVAGPAFSNIAEQTLRYLQIAPVN